MPDTSIVQGNKQNIVYTCWSAVVSWQLLEMTMFFLAYVWDRTWEPGMYHAVDSLLFMDSLNTKICACWYYTFNMESSKAKCIAIVCVVWINTPPNGPNNIDNFPLYTNTPKRQDSSLKRAYLFAHVFDHRMFGALILLWNFGFGIPAHVYVQI